VPGRVRPLNLGPLITILTVSHANRAIRGAVGMTDLSRGPGQYGANPG
jgi:hypothetical protein